MYMKLTRISHYMWSSIYEAYANKYLLYHSCIWSLRESVNVIIHIWRLRNQYLLYHSYMKITQISKCDQSYMKITQISICYIIHIWRLRKSVCVISLMYESCAHQQVHVCMYVCTHACMHVYSNNICIYVYIYSTWWDISA